jgi:hypothetical protein
MPAADAYSAAEAELPAKKPRMNTTSGFSFTINNLDDHEH